MKISEHWLRQWVNPEVSVQTLADQLTMAGLEVAAVEPVAGEFTNVVVGEVLKIVKHPQADRLNLCEVGVDADEPLHIVCGGKNVREGMKVAVAQVGAVLPGNFKIKKSKIRGEASFGMLCSTSELGMAESADGIMDLPSDSPIGADLRAYLGLNDHSIEIELTPNRGDCLSITGVAREVGVLNSCDVITPDMPAIKASCDATFPVELTSDECPHYVGRVIKGINAKAESPVWMQEALRRSGLRSISPVVDVTNYVMLELGQPMHAFDLSQLHDGIVVRKANAGEKITLLDDNELELDAEALVIADKQKPLALAGIMGGSQSGVTIHTQDVFLESAYFVADKIASRARRFGMSTDSSYRFERGVDPELQVKAIERATHLLLDIVGGEPGPLVQETVAGHLPKQKLVGLRVERVERVLGFAIPEETIVDILQRLGMTVYTQGERLEVNVPLHRFDIEIEEDLIEEVARIYGYDNIPVEYPRANLVMHPVSDMLVDDSAFKQVLVDRGYNEVVNYSFIDPKLHALIQPNVKAMELLNPISSELSLMRTSLWPDLIATMLYNLNRQQDRIRIFETGLRFIERDGELCQEPVMAGLVQGNLNSEQWGEKARTHDFFDVKADVENLLSLSATSDEFRFVAAEHDALHPGQSAKILRGDQEAGWIGVLHPHVLQTLDVVGPITVFELDSRVLSKSELTCFTQLSKFPSNRRDISFLVDDKTSFFDIRNAVTSVDSAILRDVYIFDVYAGEGIEPGQKSIALSLVMQHDERTLVDAEVSSLVDEVVASLQQKLKVTLRD